MTFEGVVNGEVVKVELTEELVNAYRKKPTGWEYHPEKKGAFWVYDAYGDCKCFNQIDDWYDEKTGCQMYEKANYYFIRELGINIDRAQTLQRKLWRRAAELCVKENWQDDGELWYIYYDYSCHSFRIGSCVCRRSFGQVYFDTQEHARQVLNEFKDELLWYYLEFKFRMD